MHDPRPLVGEPLALDLVNTRWVAGGQPQDLLAGEAGLRVWLASAGFPRAPHDPAALAAARTARDAIRDVAGDPGDAAARAALNAVLAHGRVAERLEAGGPASDVEVDDEAWRVPWLAARDLLRLLATPERVRACAGPGCVLHFFDTSRNGRRQWCSMAACGNRAKARRHYDRARGGPDEA
jgi:predicted RNA-binding Zn ribbon-like protein